VKVVGEALEDNGETVDEFQTVKSKKQQKAERQEKKRIQEEEAKREAQTEADRKKREASEEAASRLAADDERGAEGAIAPQGAAMLESGLGSVLGQGQGPGSAGSTAEAIATSSADADGGRKKRAVVGTGQASVGAAEMAGSASASGSPALGPLQMSGCFPSFGPFGAIGSLNPQPSKEIAAIWARPPAPGLQRHDGLACQQSALGGLPGLPARKGPPRPPGPPPPYDPPSPTKPWLLRRLALASSGQLGDASPAAEAKLAPSQESFVPSSSSAQGPKQSDGAASASAPQHAGTRRSRGGRGGGSAGSFGGAWGSRRGEGETGDTMAGGESSPAPGRWQKKADAGESHEAYSRPAPRRSFYEDGTAWRGKGRGRGSWARRGLSYYNDAQTSEAGRGRGGNARRGAAVEDDEKSPQRGRGGRGAGEKGQGKGASRGKGKARLL